MSGVHWCPVPSSTQHINILTLEYFTRGDPAIVYLDGVKPPSPVTSDSNQLALIPDKGCGQLHQDTTDQEADIHQDTNSEVEGSDHETPSE